MHKDAQKGLLKVQYGFGAELHDLDVVGNEPQLFEN
jgi:hypothetical protein